MLNSYIFITNIFSLKINIKYLNDFRKLKLYVKYESLSSLKINK